MTNRYGQRFTVRWTVDFEDEGVEPENARDAALRALQLLMRGGCVR